MSDAFTNEIKCPNCESPMGMGQACPKCGLEDPSMVPPSIHDDDTKEIVRVPTCESDGCSRVSDGITIIVRGQKRQVCDCCAESHYEDLDAQHNEENATINEERSERIEEV
jgi:hypothetical protein